MVLTADVLTKIINIGQTQMGVPYSLGSAAGRSSWTAAKQAYFDCSGFVAWTYFQATGIQLPAYTDSLAHDSRLQQVSTPSVGDIVLFHEPYGGAQWGHTAIYAGNGQVLESGSVDASRSAVNIMPLLGGAHRPEFFHLKGITDGSSIVTPIPGEIITIDPVPGQTPIPGQATAPATVGVAPSGTQLGSVGGLPLNIPSGLVLGLLGALLLILGAMLFGNQLKAQVEATIT